MIIGNKSVVTFLRTALFGEVRAHTFALVGPEGIGKRTMARMYACELLRCSEKQLDTHPDFYYVERAIEEKTDKLKKDITVEQARQLKSRLGAKPWMGNRQVIVINEAELINIEAGNALLKLLEEPPAGTIIFLLCANDQALLPTIRSRAQVLFLNVVSEKVLVEALLERGVEANKAALYARAAWGRPGRALTFLQTPEAFLAYEAEQATWATLVHDSFFQRVKDAATLLPDSDDGVRGREELAQVFAGWEVLFRDALRAQFVSEHDSLPGSSRLSPAGLVNTIDALAEARRLLRANVNPGLILDHLLLAF